VFVLDPGIQEFKIFNYGKGSAGKRFRKHWSVVRSFERIE
jgi:hypothetical protein